MLGRFPTEEEARQHRLSEMIPVWLPMSDSNLDTTLKNRKVANALRRLSAWLSDDYA